MRLFLTLLIIGGIIFVAMIQYAERKSKNQNVSKKGTLLKPDFKKSNQHAPPSRVSPPSPLKPDIEPSQGPLDLLNGISDPREASAALLVQMAAYDGEITGAQKALIKQQMIDHQDADEDTAESLYSFGRVTIGQLDERGDLLGKLTRPIKEYCTQGEISIFLKMLEDVAADTDALSLKQQQLLDDVSRMLGVHST